LLLPIEADGGGLINDAALIVSGAMNYPNCPQSIAHFRNVISLDEQITPGARSKIGELIHTDLVGRKRQGYVAGEVALRLIDLKRSGKDMSLNRAQFLVKEVVRGLEVIDGKGQKKSFRPNSEAGIRAAFNEFTPSCHLWAALRAVEDVFVEASNSQLALREFLNVAAWLEAQLDQIFAELPVKPWEPWRIPDVFKSDTKGVQIKSRMDVLQSILDDYHPALR